MSGPVTRKSSLNRRRVSVVMCARVCASVQAKVPCWTLQRRRLPTVPLPALDPADCSRHGPVHIIIDRNPIPPFSFSVAGLRPTPFPVPLSGRVLRMAKAAVDLSPFTWRHLFRFAERFIVAGIRSMPRPSLGRRPLLHIACSAFSAMNSNALVGLVLKNPEIHANLHYHRLARTTRTGTRAIGRMLR
jgi:hypothetical protein